METVAIDLEAAPNTEAQTESTPPPAEPPKVEPPKVNPTEEALLELLKEHREARRRAEEKEAQEAKAKQAQAAASAQKPEVLGNLVPILKDVYGLDDQEVVMALKQGIYEMLPEGVPQDMQLRIYEAKQTRAQKIAQARKDQEELAAYHHSLALAARGAKEEDYPESVAWYDGDNDRYARALATKAQALAYTAAQKGELADLSPAAVARALETDLADRQKKRETKRASKAPKAETVEAVKAVPQSVVSNKTPVSTGTSQAEPPSFDEEVLRKKAEAALAAIFAAADQESS